MSDLKKPADRPSRRFLPDRLRKRIILYFLLVLLLPGVAIPLATLPYLRQTSESSKLQESLGQASQQARLLESVMEIRAVELLMISQLPEMRRWIDARPDGRAVERENLLRALQSHLLKHAGRIDGILLTDVDGMQELRLHARTPGETDLRRLPHAHQPYVIGALHLSALHGQNLPIYISHPDPAGPIYYSTLIRSSLGEIAGVVVLEIHPDTFLDVLRIGGPGELRHVLDANGVSLRDQKPSDCLPVMAPHLTRILRTPAGHVMGPGGKDGFFLVHARARPSGQSTIQWSLVYRVPLLQIEAPFRIALQRIGLITLGALILALLIALHFSRQLSRPITRLAEAADDLCHGYWNTELPPIRYQDEIGELTDSFASMSRQLRTAHEDLLHKLQELETSEASLAREKESLGVTLRSIGEAVIVTDTAGAILSVNPVTEKILERKAGDLVGQPFARAVPIHNQTLDEPLGDLMQELLRKRPLHLDSQELLLLTGSGPMPVQLTASTISNPGSDIVGMVVVLRDLRALHSLHAEKNRAEKLQSLGVLAGGIAHDFNNLLSVIMGDLSLLVTTSEAAEQAQLRHALEAACRARDLTAQLLLFSKGGMPIKESTLLSELIRETVSFALHGSSCRFNLSAPDDVWMCPADPCQMHQVFHNLAINAIQALPGDGELDIKLENVRLGELDIPGLAAGPYLRIEVRDRGCGIAPADLPSIFDPYFTTKSSGTGLGLSSVYSIIRAHHGSISVESTPNDTRFLLYLPASPGATLSMPEIFRGAPSQPAGSHARILLLDDDPSICRTAGRLIRHLGYEVDTTQSPEEAIQHFERTPYDLVILDLTLPGTLGGVAVLEKLKALRPDIRAIVSSGYSQDPVMAKHREHGFISRIPKPYTLDELKHCIQESLS